MNITRDHVVSWGKFAFVALPVLSACAAVFFQLEDSRNSDDDIKKEQVEIRKELALQTADLEEIRSAQGTILETVEHGNEKVEGLIVDALQGMAIDVGRLIERTEQ